MTSPKRAKMNGIEAGRGIAALLVASVHSSDHLFQAHGEFLFGRVFVFGHAGVDFFFVLSGFIILHVHAGDIGRPSRAWHYAKRRIARVVPLLWAVIAFGVLLPQFKSAPGVDWLRVLNNALLVPTVSDPFIGVCWTLQHEAVFYVLFVALILNLRLGLAVLAAWLASIVIFTWGRIPTESGLLFRLTNWFDLQFFLGLFAAWLLRRARVPAPFLVLGFGVLGFLAVGAIEDLRLFVPTTLPPHLGYGFTAMLIVLGLVECERSGRLRIPKFLVRLGSASYSTYLTHLFAIGALWQVLLRTGLDAALPPWVQLILLVIAAALGGLVVSYVVEQPGSRLARDLLDGKRPTLSALFGRRGRPPAESRSAVLPGE